jgi:recombination protein RecA
MTASTAQQKALDAIFAKVEKKHKGALTTMGRGNQGLIRGTMQTPLEALDRWLLGIGGLCWERIIEVYGPESSGKSSLVMGAIASVQKAGGVGFYIDAENVLTQERSLTMGIDKEQLVMAPDPEDAEHAGELLLDTMLACPKDVPFLAVYDSIPAMETRAEAKGDVGDNFMSPMARHLSQYLRKLVRALKGRAAHVIFVNQTREKPGVMFGSPEYTPGGKALKFYASVRLRTKGVKRRDGGLEIIIKNVKNKLAEPHRELTTFLHFKKGWDNAWTTMNLAKDLKLIPNDLRETNDNLHKARVALEWPAAEAAERLGAEPGKVSRKRGK